MLKGGDVQERMKMEAKETATMEMKSAVYRFSIQRGNRLPCYLIFSWFRRGHDALQKDLGYFTRRKIPKMIDIVPSKAKGIHIPYKSESTPLKNESTVDPPV